MFAASSVLNTSFKGARHIQQKTDFLGIGREVNTILSDPKSCPVSMLNSQDPRTRAKFNPDVPPDPADTIAAITLNGSVFAAVNQNLPGFRVAAMELTEVDPAVRTIASPTSTRYLARLSIQATKIGTSIAGENMARSFVLWVVANNASATPASQVGVIQECYMAPPESPILVSPSPTASPTPPPSVAGGPWQAVSLVEGIAPHNGKGVALWTGSKIITIRGYPPSGSPNEPNAVGSTYDPVTDTWGPGPYSADSSFPRAFAFISDTPPFGAVWTGSKVVMYGDMYQNRGGVWDPATSTFTPMSFVGAPAFRGWPAVVWTGSKMIAWGGVANGPSYYNTGGVYDPATNTWSPMSTVGAPSARSRAYAIWTGTKMIVWGGVDALAATNVGLQSGGIYDPATNTWSSMSMVGAPPMGPAVWDGSRMLMFGGEGHWFGGMVSLPIGNVRNTGGIYNPTTNTWSSMSTTGGPTPRMMHSMAWTGTHLMVWGGRLSQTEPDAVCFGTMYGSPPGYPLGCPSRSGWLYSPSSDSWSAMTLLHAPVAAESMSATWTGKSIILLGGSPAVQGGVSQGAAYTP